MSCTIKRHKYGGEVPATQYKSSLTHGSLNLVLVGVRFCLPGHAKQRSDVPVNGGGPEGGGEVVSCIFTAFGGLARRHDDWGL